MLKLLWIAVLVVVVDQISKLAAVKYLTAHAIEVTPFLNLSSSSIAVRPLGYSVTQRVGKTFCLLLSRSSYPLWLLSWRDD